jgi:enamine deaminase RidA (YjgF/YER057c/UK114 family)
VGNHPGVSKSYFIEDYTASVVEEFLSDLEGAGNGSLVDYIQDQSWHRGDAERMAAIIRGLPRPFAGVTINESKEHSGYWEVLSVRKEVV